MIGVILLAVASALPAATTGQINYQARLLDTYGRNVNDTVSLAFKLYDAAKDGNLLWSETHAGVVVLNGIYSVDLGSTTPIPASVFTRDSVYLELAINNETMTPRQLITYAGQALVARTVMGEDIFVDQVSGKVGIGTTTPAEKLDVAGTIKVTGFKLPTGAIANYALLSDGNGTGQWRPITAGIMETDPVFNAWSASTYAPATGNLWTAVGNLNTSTGALDTAVGLLQGATNALNTATNALNTHVVSLIGWTNAVIGATNALNTATNALNTHVVSLIGWTNAVIGATNALNTASQNKLDRLNGIAGNLTVTGTFMQAVATSTQIVDVGASIAVTDTFILIMGTNSADATASIAGGGPAGQIIILQGQSDTATVTLTNNPGLVELANDVPFTFKKNNTMQLIWNNGVWAELNRIAHAQ